MSSYLMDSFYSQNHFLKMKWTWNPTHPPVHVYYSLLCDCKHRSTYERICNKFLLPFHHFFIGKSTMYIPSRKMKNHSHPLPCENVYVAYEDKFH